jgi:MFS family permease
VTTEDLGPEPSPSGDGLASPPPARDAIPGGTFASLQVNAYRTLFWSAMISFASIQGQGIARAWLANEITDSNTGLGGVLFAFGITMLIANPVGGVVADRFSRKGVLIATQLLMVFSSLWMGLAITFDFLTYGQLLATSAIQALAFAFLGPARMAMTSELVGADLLPNAIVLGQMSANSTRIIGPSLVGWMIGVAWIGSEGVYYVATALSVVATWQIMKLPSRKTLRVHAGRSPIEEFGDGIRYARDHREVKLLLFTSFFVVMIAFPFQGFLARVATVSFDEGAKGFGYLSAASAVGAVAVTLSIARFSRPEVAWRIQTTAGFCFGAFLFILAWAPSFYLALVAVALLGGASSAFTAMNNTLTLTLSDLAFHGRLQSLMMLSFSGFGLAALPLGRLADSIGLEETFAIMGAVTLVVMTISATTRVRWPDDRPSLS